MVPLEQTAVKPSLKHSREHWPDKRGAGALRRIIDCRELIRSLILRDIRSRYKQSVLGIAWALIQPLAMMLVFTVVFAGIAKVKTAVPYPLFAYSGLMLWTFFAQSITAGAECLVTNYNLITKVYFPREVFPITAVFGKTVDLCLGLCLLVPLFVVFSVKLTWLVVFVVPILAAQVCFMLGICFALSAVNLFYRDVKHITPLMLTIWMYLTPIVYPLDKVPAKYLIIFKLNPMCAFSESCRRVMLLGKAPVWGDLGLAVLISVLTLIIGYKVFKALEPSFAEMI